MGDNLEELQSSIHYRFQQVKLLETALTHSSCVNERDSGGEHNERLEFLGDAVLELVVSERLYRSFPDADEGHLTRLRAKLVSRPTLAAVARRLGLEHHLLLGRGEEQQGGRERASLLSDSLEALIGAVFLDGGYEAAKPLVAALFADWWPDKVESQKTKDFKSRLQELTQKTHRDRPVYTLIGSFGPEHAKEFEVSLRLPDGESVSALGQSVKKAEQRAAEKALELLLGREAG